MSDEGSGVVSVQNTETVTLWRFAVLDTPMGRAVAGPWESHGNPGGSNVEVCEFVPVSVLAAAQAEIDRLNEIVDEQATWPHPDNYAAAVNDAKEAHAELAAARTELDETRSDRDYWRTRAAEQTERAESSEAVAVQLREALDEAREHLTEAERLMSVLLATNPYDRDGILEDIALFVESPDSLTSRAVLSGSPQPESPDYGKHFAKSIARIRELPPEDRSAISNRRTSGSPQPEGSER